NGGYAARWHPVFTGPDAAAFRDLATAMPPLCRAVRPARPGEVTPAAQVLRETLNGLTDAAMRRALPERLLAGPRPGPKSPLPDRWLAALTAEDATIPGARPPGGSDVAELTKALDEWYAAAQELEGPVRVS